MNEHVAGAHRKSGRPIEEALTAGQNRPERLPGLLTVLGQLPKELTEESKSIVYLQPRVRLLDVAAATFGEAAAAAQGAVIGAVWAERWRQRIYFLADEMLAALFIEVAAGGESPVPTPPLGRAVSAAECDIVEVLYRRVARALTNALSVLVDVTFEVVTVAEKLDAEQLPRPAAPVIIARLSVEWLGQLGVLSLILPLAALDPIRDVLESGPAAEVANQPPEVMSDWSRQLSEEIARAFVTVNAVLEERLISLDEVRRLAVGRTIELACTDISKVRLDAEENPAFWCELGKSGGSLIARIEREFDPSEAPLESI